MSDEERAKRLNCHRITLSRWRSGEPVNVSLARARHMAAVCETTIDALLPAVEMAVAS